MASEKYPPTVGELIAVLSQLDPEASIVMRTPHGSGDGDDIWSDDTRCDWDICGVFVEGDVVVFADYGLSDGTDLLTPAGICDNVGSDTPEQDRARMLLKFKTRERF